MHAYDYEYMESMSTNFRCSIDETYDFLRIVGPTNRQCIRRLELEFECSETFEQPEHGPKSSRRRTRLGKAFALLSQRHSLRFLTLKFDYCFHVFAFATSGPLITEFSKLQGLERLSIYSCEEKFPADDPTECRCYNCCFEDEEDLTESIEVVQDLIRNAESKDDTPKKHP